MAFCDLFQAFQPIRVDEAIYLRQHAPEQDARAFWEIYNDEDNFRYYSGYKKPNGWNEKVAIRVVESRVKGFQGKREYSWVVAYKGEVIGQIQLFNFSNHNTCGEVGYFLKKKYWNQGINTRVLKAVCKFGFDVMGFERIEAMAHVENIGLNRTLQKAGFTREGMMRKHFYIRDRAEDGYMYSIIKEESLPGVGGRK